MFEKFLSENAESFRQRYEGTYGFFRSENGKRKLVRLTAIRENRCDFEDADGIPYHIAPDTVRNLGFEFLPPKSQWYNTENGAMLTQRVASRQFQRGISPKNVVITAVGRNGVPQPVQVNFINLASIYDRFVPASLAMEDFIHERANGVAISGQFALTTSGHAVWLFNDMIGAYKRDKRNFKVTLNEPTLWRTEIADALNRLECTAEIS